VCFVNCYITMYTINLKRGKYSINRYIMISTNSSQTLDIRKLIVIILTIIPAAIVIDTVLAETWTSVITIVSYHSMLSFLAIICAGFILVQYRVREHSEDTVYHAALIYAAIVNIGRVVRITFDSSIINGYGEASSLFNELVFLAIFSCLIFLGALMKKNQWIWHRTYAALILIIGGLLLHIGILYLVVPFVPVNFIIPLGVVIGLIPSFALPITGVIWVKLKSQSAMFDLTYLGKRLVRNYFSNRYRELCKRVTLALI